MTERQRMTADEAQRVYDAHIPDPNTHACRACFGDVRWPCRPYRDARDTLIAAGVLQDGPVQPCV